MEFPIKGVKNVGNACFLNVIVCVLLHNPLWKKMYEHKSQTAGLLRKIMNGPTKDNVSELYKSLDGDFCINKQDCSMSLWIDLAYKISEECPEFKDFFSVWFLKIKPLAKKYSVSVVHYFNKSIIGYEDNIFIQNDKKGIVDAELYKYFPYFDKNNVEAKSPLYFAYAFIIHMGATFNSGHYVSIINNGNHLTPDWYYQNDNTVEHIGRDFIKKINTLNDWTVRLTIFTKYYEKKIISVGNGNYLRANNVIHGDHLSRLSFVKDTNQATTWDFCTTEDGKKIIKTTYKLSYTKKNVTNDHFFYLIKKNNFLLLKRKERIDDYTDYFEINMSDDVSFCFDKKTRYNLSAI